MDSNQDQRHAIGGEMVQSGTRERPQLLQKNLKLRHLRGLSLRNLSLVDDRIIQDGLTNKAIDDDSLPGALRTPAKELAAREIKILEHSKSSDDLTQATPSVDLQVAIEPNGKKQLETGKVAKSKPRRRSTQNWASTTSQTRNEKLEQIAAQRMADTWFSLHADGVERPIYISEAIHRATNPCFNDFDLDVCGPSITRRSRLTIKYWARAQGAQIYSLLIEARIDLRSLSLLCQRLEDMQYGLPQNTIVFHMTDGIYISSVDLPLAAPLEASPMSNRGLTQSAELTSSFDALMRLSNLDDCIQDALATRNRLTKQIDALLVKQRNARDTITRSVQAEERIDVTTTYLSACQRQVNAMKDRRSVIKASLFERRRVIESNESLRTSSKERIASINSSRVRLQEGRLEIKSRLAGQIRRIGEELSFIYPIHPISSGSLSFSIRSLPLCTHQLENTTINRTTREPSDPDAHAAALGHAAHMTHLLSFYLSVPLSYQVSPRGSTSTVYDPISTSLPSEASRTFPLYEKSVVPYRYEYGLFLLNANIELLMTKSGARAVNLRHTAGNLKYLITIITEGKGEVPGRKRGVLRGWQQQRGLLGPPTGKTSSGSRDSSLGSVPSSLPSPSLVMREKTKLENGRKGHGYAELN